jgi:hypothetical protein
MSGTENWRDPTPHAERILRALEPRIRQLVEHGKELRDVSWEELCVLTNLAHRYLPDDADLDAAAHEAFEGRPLPLAEVILAKLRDAAAMRNQLKLNLMTEEAPQ